jgi:hypothetical protein
MDFWQTVVVLFRRWYITVPAFFLSLVLAGAAYSVVPIQYQSVGVLVLTTPLSGGTETSVPNRPEPITNPLMNFDHSLALTASIVIQQMGSPETARSLGVTPGGTVTYEINNGTSNPELLESGPFIFVLGTGPSPQAAQDIAQRVAEMAAVVLDQRQTELNAPTGTHISTQIVVAPTPGKPLLSSPLRAAAAAGVLAGLAGLAAVYGFESLMTHRRRRREEKQRAARQSDESPEAVDGLGTTVGVPGRWSTNLDHGVNGSARRARPAGTVGLLEGPFDDDRSDRPPRGRATDEK